MDTIEVDSFKSSIDLCAAVVNIQGLKFPSNLPKGELSEDYVWASIAQYLLGGVGFFFVCGFFFYVFVYSTE